MIVRQRMAIYMKEMYRKEDKENQQEVLDKYNSLLERKRGLENLMDATIIENARIVGMTTNGCAKFSSILE